MSVIRKIESGSFIPDVDQINIEGQKDVKAKVIFATFIEKNFFARINSNMLDKTESKLFINFISTIKINRFQTDF